jgi:hypothetical protein
VYRVRQQVTAIGDQKTVVRFVLRKPGHPLSTVPMEVTYHGEAPTEAPRAGRRLP